MAKRFMYVCTKKLPDENDGGKFKPRLIGILTELKPGNGIIEHGTYQFEYKIGGRFRIGDGNWGGALMLDEFDNPNRVYTGREVEMFMRKYILNFNSRYFAELLDAAGLKEYDEWEYFSFSGLNDMQQHAYLYKTLPPDVMLYEDIEGGDGVAD